MASLDNWEEFKKTVTPLNECYRMANSVLIRNGFARTNKPPTLAIEFANVMQQKQQSNLISRIYECSGIGAPPISGGKIELHKRSKRF